MKHIQNRNDWFYEMRPQMMVLFGILGLFTKLFIPSGSEPVVVRLGQACGIVLLVLAIKIMDWRKTHREAFRRLRIRRS